MTVTEIASITAAPKLKDVLIVEDVEATRAILRAVVESLPIPCSVREATRAEEALELVEQRRPDLVLLDIVLANSELSGIGVCQALRKYPHITVAVVSACQEASVTAACFSLGVADFISKPFSVDDLRARLQGWLES